MRAFRIRGHWYLPERENDSVAGVLTFRPGKGISLSISGSLFGDDPLGAQSYPRILGIVERDEPGRFVTLLDCFATRTQISMPGFGSQRLHAGGALFCREQLLNPRAFNSCHVRFQYLDEWASAGRGMGGSSFQAFSYTQPLDLIAHIDSDAILLRFSLETSRTKNTFRASEKAIFVATLEQPLDPEAMIHRCVRPLAQLLMLATDKPVDIDELILGAGEGAEEKLATFVFQQVSDSHFDSQQKSPDFLFRLRDIEGDFDVFLREWHALGQSCATFFGAFFGLITAPPRFVEQRFLWLLHSITLLSGMPNTPQQSANLEAEALSWLVTSVEPLREAVLPSDVNGFISDVLAARKDILLGAGINPQAVVWMHELLKWMIKGSLLLRLSPLSAKAPRLFDQSRQLAFVRGKVNAG